MDPDYRQAITAAETGSVAAPDAESWLEVRALENESIPAGALEASQ